MNISVKSGSSVWQLATLWGDERVPDNFCSLFWRVVLRFILIASGCVITGLFLGFFVAGVAASISVGYVIWTMPIVIVSGIAAIVCVSILYGFLHYKTTESIDENPSGFVSNSVNAYLSWKNKYCPKVVELD